MFSPKVKTYLKVSLGGEGLLADGALERFVSGVRAHVDLQGGRRGEVLIANVAQVLGQACNKLRASSDFSISQQQQRQQQHSQAVIAK